MENKEASVLKKKKNNRKLIIQTLLVAGGLFIVVAIALMNATAYYSYQIYLTSRREILDGVLRQLQTVTSVYKPYSYFLDGWEQYVKNNYDEVSLEDIEKGRRIYDKLLQEALDMRGRGGESIEDLSITEQAEISAYITPERINELTDEEEELLVQAVYDSLFSDYISQVLQNDPYSMVCCFKLDDKTLPCMAFGGQKEFKGADPDSCLAFNFGDQIPDILLEQKEVQSILAGEQTFAEKKNLYEVWSSKETDQQLYFGYAPLFENGKLLGVICVAYDFTGFEKTLYGFYKKIFSYVFIGLLLYSALLVFFMYRFAIGPLSTVNASIREYRLNKDSEKVVQQMETVKTRNELGALAESFAEMATEIDAYTKESLRINGEKERAAAELGLAARIQQEALPHVYPERDAFSMAASMAPAREIGGDFYDFFFIDEDHLGLVIADVSDKGIPAALFMMMSKDMIKNFTMIGGSPAEVLQRVNQHLCENNENGMFVTVWLGVLDISTGLLTAANAGHEYPILRREGGTFELVKDKHGTVLGAFKNRKYQNYDLQLNKGDILFLYTDGAPEATSVNDEMFTTNRMLEVLNAASDNHPDVLLSDMKTAIDAFAEGAGQFDDLTMLSIRYNGGQD